MAMIQPPGVMGLHSSHVAMLKAPTGMSFFLWCSSCGHQACKALLAHPEGAPWVPRLHTPPAQMQGESPP